MHKRDGKEGQGRGKSVGFHRGYDKLAGCRATRYVGETLERGNNKVFDRGSLLLNSGLKRSPKT